MGAKVATSRLTGKLRSLSSCARFSIGLTVLVLVGLILATAVTGDMALLKIAGVLFWFTGIFALLEIFGPANKWERCNAR